MRNIKCLFYTFFAITYVNIDEGDRVIELEACGARQVFYGNHPGKLDPNEAFV